MKLKKKDIERISNLYSSTLPRKQVQETLAAFYNVTERTIRGWAKELGLGLNSKNIHASSKILVYDIETSRVKADVWWSGKQYISYKQLTEEPRIITIAYKWLGDDKVHHLTWDEEQSDKEMLRKFLEIYNKAGMVIGQNNDKFDNRWINARAMKFGFTVNVFVKSFDIMKETKRLFRLPSYSMDYITKFLGVENKLEHEGIIMWKMIQDGTPDQQKEYLAKMVEYNVQDIVATEEMYLKMRKYMGHKIHSGVEKGLEKFTCPNCGGYDVQLVRTITTAAGTIQRVMQCDEDEVQYKINNRTYINFLEYEFNKNKEENQLEN
jgi:hypothetical protein